MSEEKTNFHATYFERDSILRLARLADIFAWASLAYAAYQSFLSILIFFLQLTRGLLPPAGFTDYAQQLAWMLQPAVSGLFYFVGLKAIGQFLLIMMDVEDNLRRAARNKTP